MKYLLVILLLIGKSFLTIAQPYKYSSYENSKDYLLINLFNNVIPPQEYIYENVLRSHDANKMMAQRDSAMEYLKVYANNAIALIREPDQRYNADSGYAITLITMDNSELKLNLYSLFRQPLKNENYSNPIFKYTFNENFYLPSMGLLNYKLEDENIFEIKARIYAKYIKQLVKENILYKTSLTHNEIKNLSDSIFTDIDYTADSTFKALLMFQLELFIYNNGKIWSNYYFYNFRVKHIEEFIGILNAHEQVTVYYYMGRMLSELGRYSEAYKYYFKAYYSASKHVTNNELGLQSLYNAYFILCMNYDNYYFREKRFNILPLFKPTNKNDSINLVLLKELTIMYNVIDNYTQVDTNTRFSIYVYTIYDMINTLRFAQQNNLLISNRVASLCYNELTSLCGVTYNHQVLAVNYYALSIKNTMFNSEFVSQAVKPMTDMVDYLLNFKDYKNSRIMLNDALTISNAMNSVNYAMMPISKLAYYYSSLGQTDSVYYIKHVMDSLYDNNLLTAYAINKYYEPTLKMIQDKYQDSNSKIRINKIPLPNKNDYTLEYANYERMEQEAKDEVNELENKKILAVQKDYEKYLLEQQKDNEREELRKILNSTIRIKELKLKELDKKLRISDTLLAKSKREKDSISGYNETLKATSDSLQIAIQDATDTLDARNDTLISRQKSINELNQSVQELNTVSWILASLFFLTSIGLSITLFLLNRSYKYASGFMQKRLVYHQSKNDNLSFEQSIDLALGYADSITPKNNNDKISLTNLKSKLNNLSAYLTHLFIYQESTIVNSKKQFVTLEEEIENVINYVELEKYKKTMHIDIIPSSIVKSHWEKLMIPSNILQPFIENSIKHGFETHAMNKIEIDLVKENNQYNLILSDNGKGINLGLLHEKYKKRTTLNFFKNKDLNNDKSISLSDIEEYLIFLWRPFKRNITFNIYKNIKTMSNGKGTIIELENLKSW